MKDFELIILESMENKQIGTVVNRQAVKMLLGTKKDFYEAMQRNGFFLPSIKSSIINLEWMQLVSFLRSCLPLELF